MKTALLDHNDLERLDRFGVQGVQDIQIFLQSPTGQDVLGQINQQVLTLEANLQDLRFEEIEEQKQHERLFAYLMLSKKMHRKHHHNQLEEAYQALVDFIAKKTKKPAIESPSLQLTWSISPELTLKELEEAWVQLDEQKKLLLEDNARLLTEYQLIETKLKAIMRFDHELAPNALSHNPLKIRLEQDKAEYQIALDNQTKRLNELQQQLEKVTQYIALKRLAPTPNMTPLNNTNQSPSIIIETIQQPRQVEEHLDIELTLQANAVTS
jgi:hypothetical protein